MAALVSLIFATSESSTATGSSPMGSAAPRAALQPPAANAVVLSEMGSSAEEITIG